MSFPSSLRNRMYGLLKEYILERGEIEREGEREGEIEREGEREGRGGEGGK